MVDLSQDLELESLFFGTFLGSAVGIDFPFIFDVFWSHFLTIFGPKVGKRDCPDDVEKMLKKRIRGEARVIPGAPG